MQLMSRAHLGVDLDESRAVPASIVERLPPGKRGSEVVELGRGAGDLTVAMEIEIRGKEPRAIGPNRSPQRRLDFRALGHRGHRADRCRRSIGGSDDGIPRCLKAGWCQPWSSR